MWWQGSGRGCTAKPTPGRRPQHSGRWHISPGWMTSEVDDGRVGGSASSRQPLAKVGSVAQQVVKLSSAPRHGTLIPTGDLLEVGYRPHHGVDQTRTLPPVGF